MSDIVETTGQRLIEGAKEALAVARGEQPAASIWINGHEYVPAAEIQRLRDELASARAAAFEEAAGIAETAVIEPGDTEQPGDDDWFSRMCANGQATVIASLIRSRAQEGRG